MKKIILFSLFILFPILANAQATTSNRLAWTQPNVATVAEAQAMTYKYYPDAATIGIVLQDVTCVGVPTSPASIECSTPYPAFTPGSHSLQLTATNAAGESLKSVAFNFTFMVVPSAPISIRIQ